MLTRLRALREVPNPSVSCLLPPLTSPSLWCKVGHIALGAAGGRGWEVAGSLEVSDT